MRILKNILVATLSLIPMFAMAHPGHEHTQSSFLSGFVHPFTGLDHLMMALALGVLIWTGYQRWNIAGGIGLAVAMIAGFMLGSHAILSANLAEYGIVASLLLLAAALWMKAHQIIPVFALALASFHGVAHGAELGQHGNPMLLVLGMVSAMSLIYVAGLTMGALLKKHVPYGQQAIGVCAAIVAILGFA